MNPLLSTRVFGICLRAGVFTPPPRRLLREVRGVYDIPDPQTSYQSNLSRVLLRKAVENSDLFLRRVAEIAAYNPGILDELDLAFHVRELGRAFGFKAPFLRPSQDVAEMLAKKVAMQEKAMQQQELMAAADTASKFAPNVQSKMMEKTGL